MSARKAGYCVPMGFLTDGNTLPWEQVSKVADYIRAHGVKQFIEIYRSAKDRCNDSLKWGDEVRY